MLIETLFTLLLSAEAGEQHRHVHGHGEASVAFDGTTGEFELRAPADSFYGFERKPRNKKEEAAVQAAHEKIESEIARMLVLDGTLACRFEKKSIEFVQQDGSHGEVKAVFKIDCAKSPAGTSVRAQFAAVFPRLRTVDLTVLVGDVQKSGKVGRKGLTLELK